MENQNLMFIEYLKNKQMKSIFHSHPNYELFYFHEGHGNYLIGDQIYSLSPGDLIFIKGMTLHCPNMNESNKYIRSIVSFDPDYIRAIAGRLFTIDLLEPFELGQNFRIRLQDGDKDKFEAYLAMLDGYSDKEDTVSINRYRLLFLEMLLELYGLCAKEVERKAEWSSKKEEAAQLAISYIGKHFADNVGLDQIAQHLHLNKEYLSRVFKQVTGVTVFNYLYQRRINEAKIWFLLNNRLSVTEVCYQVGFKNLSHFSRMFKEKVGCSPDQYKRQFNKKSIPAK